MEFWQVIMDVIHPGSPRSTEIRQRLAMETERLRGYTSGRVPLPDDPLERICVVTEDVARFH